MGTVPPAWFSSNNIQPSYKGYGDKQDRNNYRGITLQSCIANAKEHLLQILMIGYAIT